MGDERTAAAFERFRKLEEQFVEDIYTVLEISKSEENTRKFFEKCLKKAQDRYADQHADEIMAALEAGLKQLGTDAENELDKKRRMLAALKKIASE